MKSPPDGLRYGSWRDWELTEQVGNRPFATFWIAMAVLAAAFLLQSAGIP